MATMCNLDNNKWWGRSYISSHFKHNQPFQTTLLMLNQGHQLPSGSKVKLRIPTKTPEKHAALHLLGCFFIYFYFSNPAANHLKALRFKWRSQTGTASSGVLPTETNSRSARVNAENISEAAGSLLLEDASGASDRLNFEIRRKKKIAKSEVEFGAVVSRRTASHNFHTHFPQQPHPRFKVS